MLEVSKGTRFIFTAVNPGELLWKRDKTQKLEEGEMSQSYEHYALWCVKFALVFASCEAASFH